MKWLVVPFLALAITAYSGFMVVETTGSFAPNTPDNLELWFDGDDNNGAGDSTTGDDTSGAVAWQDKSGNNLDAGTGTLPDYAGNVQNGKAGILFNGTDDCGVIGDHADLDCVTGCTVAVVAKTAASLAHGRLLSKQDDASNLEWGVAFPSFATDSNDITFALFGDDTNTASWHGRTESNSITTSTSYIFMVSYNGGTAGPTDLSIDLNGVLDVDDTTQNTGSDFPPDDAANSVRMGCRNTVNANFFAGHIMELIFYSDELSAGEKASLFTYLNTKWAVY